MGAQALEAALVAAFVGAAAVSFVLTPLVRRAAVALGVLDLPDQRKVHTSPVPRLGGIAVGIAMAVAVLAALIGSPTLRAALFSGSGVARWAALAGAALAMLLIGALDDWRGLPADLKLAIEIAAAGVVVLVAKVPERLVIAPYSAPLALGWLGAALAVVWIVTLTNAVNMTDVVDGAAGGIGLVCALALGLASLALGRVVATAVLLGLAGALLGFLPHNFRTPRIFLGDSGSLLVGFLLGSASIVGLEAGRAWLAVPAVLAVAVPLAECGLTVTRRLLRALAIVRPGSSRERFLLQRGRAGLFVPDRRHVPHRLLELGFGRWSALGVLYAVTLGCGVLAIAAVRWPLLGLPALLACAALLGYVAPRWLYEELRLLDRGAFLPLLETRLFQSRVSHVVYDGAAVAVSFFAAHLLTAGRSWSDASVLAQTGVVVPATLVGFKLAGLYRGSYREAGLAEAARALRAVVAGGALGVGATLAVFAAPAPVSGVVVHLYLLLTLVAGARFAFRVLEYVYQRAQLAGRRVLIFGADRAGRRTLSEMLSRPDLGLCPVAFVEDDGHRSGDTFQGYPVHAAHGDDLAAVLRALQVSDLIVPAGSLSPARLAAVGTLCRTHGVRLVHFEGERGDLEANVLAHDWVPAAGARVAQADAAS